MKGLRFVIRVLAVLFGLSVLAVFVYKRVTQVGPDEVREAAAAYGQQCRVPSDRVERIFGEAAAEGAKGPVAEVQAKLMADYKRQIGQATFGDRVTALQFELEKALGYDPEQSVRQIAMHAGIKALKDDLGKCRLAENRPSLAQLMEGKMEAPASEGAPIPGPTTLKEADAVSQEAARQAEETYRAQWREIQTNPQAFLDRCIRRLTDLGIQLGGMPEKEAMANAQVACRDQLTSMRQCMAKPSAQVSGCFEEAFERGD